MFRLLFPLLLAVTLPAQTPKLDKPPRDVDDALRARIKQFYDYHVAAKYRQAEQLIAEESKDDFYVLSKPELKSFQIGNIEYSDRFTKAKVVIIGSMPVLLPMAGGKIMDMPFASYWKKEKGVWCWYYNKEALRHTPFGEAKAPDTKVGDGPKSLPTPPTISVAGLQSALQIDHTRVDLIPGKAETLKVTSSLPGLATLSVDCPSKPIAQTGITATFDKSELKGKGTAILTLTVAPDAPTGTVPLQIFVAPTNQVLNFTVNITR